jgi:hypothetical protein
MDKLILPQEKEVTGGAIAKYPGSNSSSLMGH